MAAPKQEAVLRVNVRCTELPGLRFDDPYDHASPRKESIHLAVQKGRDVVGAVPADRKEAKFVAEFRVEKRKDGAPNFLGPYAQGKADDRFFYLTWGVSRRAGEFLMFRRMKIRLGHLKWTEIERSVASGKPLEVALRCTDTKGGPLCATPPPTHVKWSVA